MPRGSTFYEPSRRPQSPDQRLREENDSISVDFEAEHRMAVAALRIHQHRHAQPPPDLPREAAEHIKSLLPLQLPPPGSVAGCARPPSCVACAPRGEHVGRDCASRGRVSRWSAPSSTTKLFGCRAASKMTRTLSMPTRVSAGGCITRRGTPRRAMRWACGCPALSSRNSRWMRKVRPPSKTRASPDRSISAPLPPAGVPRAPGPRWRRSSPPPEPGHVPRRRVSGPPGARASGTGPAGGRPRSPGRRHWTRSPCRRSPRRTRPALSTAPGLMLV